MGKNENYNYIQEKSPLKINSNKELSDGKNHPLNQLEKENNEIKLSKKRKDSNIMDEIPNKKSKKNNTLLSVENQFNDENENNNNNNNNLMKDDTNKNNKDFSSIPTSKDKIFNIMFTGTKPTEQDIKVYIDIIYNLLL